MRHDPERTAAAYLAGDDGWREVTAGRQGRALAESLREVAPQHLRERIRATIAAAPAPPRRRIRLGTRMPALLGVVAALLAAAVAGGLLAARERAPAQPAPITAAVASYREGVAAWTPTGEPPPARQLDGLTWQGATRGELAGLPVVAHTYQDVARHASSGATWTARVDGAVLYCADHPAPSLVVGADQAEVLVAAQQLGLR